MRQVNIQTLSKALQQLREQTLLAFKCYVSADKLTLPYQSGLNPPVWELGHVAWFQEVWIARNSQRSSGLAYDRTQPLKASRLDGADAWFDSAKIPQATRWNLELLNHQQCIAYAQQTLAQTLELLHQETDHSPALYFYWLVLQHEAMHLEASAYMAQSLGLPFKASWQQEAANGDTAQSTTAQVPSRTWQLGSSVSNFYLNDTSSNALAYSQPNERPYCFDNELIEKNCVMQAFEISLRPVSWAQYLKFVAATGYQLPKYIRKTDIDFEVEFFGRWAPLNMEAPAVHLSWSDAQTYCAWAKCRLPTEAEWDCAAKTLSDFEWGRVWEWTQDAFAPYEGFIAHPYTEYSQPWFGTHKVLRGASHLTHPVLKHVNYRNFFTPERDDIYAGFRTCAL